MKPYDHVVDQIAGASLIRGMPWTAEREEAHWRYRAPQIPQPEAALFQAMHPPTGRVLPKQFRSANKMMVIEAGVAASGAFKQVDSWNPPAARATLLDAIAARLHRHRDLILAVASRETGLTRKRLARELDRANGTLEMFAGLIRERSWVRAAIDTRSLGTVGPGHDIRRMLRPLGPVAVFGASNFPLAYGVVGGDTASALAAGCPVVVKGHPLHPATGEYLATLVTEAVRELCPDHTKEAHNGFRDGVFSFLHSGGNAEHEIGAELVGDMFIRAVGFTGSQRGGRALMELATQRGGKRRPDPIPIFAEMGSANPIVVLPGAASARAEAIADEVARSIIDSSGQQCTCAGFLFLPHGDGGDRLAARLRDRLARWRPRAMLGATLAAGYRERLSELAASPGASVWIRDHGMSADSTSANPCAVMPAIVTLESPRALWADDTRALEEVFGPAVVVVRYAPDDDVRLRGGLEVLDGSLVASIYAEPAEPGGQSADGMNLATMIAALSAKAGRVVINGPPTGVRVAHGMVHGGPWPATNRPDTTAVGPYAIERWCRPVCFQNCPDALLPPELQDANPLGILRVVNGVPTRDVVARA